MKRDYDVDRPMAIETHTRASRIIEFMNCWSQMTYIQCNEVEEQLLQIKVDWPIRLANGYRDPHPMASRIIDFMNCWSWQMIYIHVMPLLRLLVRLGR